MINDKCNDFIAFNKMQTVLNDSKNIGGDNLKEILTKMLREECFKCCYSGFDYRGDAYRCKCLGTCVGVTIHPNIIKQLSQSITQYHSEFPSLRE